MIYLASMNRSDQRILVIDSFRVIEKKTGKILVNIPDLKVFAGKILGIKSPSGTGKSVFLRTIAMLTTLEKGLETSGEILLKDSSGDWIDLLSTSVNKSAIIRKELIGMILQEPLASFPPGRTVGQILTDILMDNNIYAGSKKNLLIEELILKVGLDNPQQILQKYPEELSGGQLQRIAISCCLAKKSKIILADEPTSSLDSIQKVNFMKLVKEIQHNEELTWILASHDSSLLDALCDDIYILSDDKKIKVKESPESIMSSRQKAIGEKSLKLIEVKNLNYNFNHQKKAANVLQNINITFYLNTITAICGPSGCGKTTLAKILSGFYKKYKGNIHYRNKDLNEMATDEYNLYRSKVKYMHQDAWDSFNPAYTAKQILTHACNDAGISIHSINTIIHSITEQCLLSIELLDSYPYQLSGGERQRLHLARCLLFEPELLIMDEPMSGMDPEQSHHFYTLLQKLIEQRSLSIIWITHNLEEIKWVSDHLIVMWDGRIAESGPTKIILKNPVSDATKKLIHASIYM